MSQYKCVNDTAWVRYLVVITFHILSRNWSFSSGRSDGILFMPPRLCIKSSLSTTLAEAEVLEYVRRNTSIPVPKVYSAFVHGGRTYIVMERISGQSISNGWTLRTDDLKARILSQLRSMIKELRDLHPPENSELEAQMADQSTTRVFRNYRSGAQFNTIREIHRRPRNGIDESTENQDIPGLSELVAFHRQSCPQPVFTHEDLSSLNILARADKVVGIVDWETAGWLRSYWECVCAWNVNLQNTFWQQEVNKFLDPFPEAIEMETVWRKYFGDF